MKPGSIKSVNLELVSLSLSIRFCQSEPVEDPTNKKQKCISTYL